MNRLRRVGIGQVRISDDNARVTQLLVILGAIGATSSIIPMVLDTTRPSGAAPLWLLSLPLLCLLIAGYARRLVRWWPFGVVFGMPALFLISAAVFLIATDTTLPAAMLYFGLPVMVGAHQLRSKAAWALTALGLSMLGVSLFVLTPFHDASHSLLYGSVTIATITSVMIKTRDAVQNLLARSARAAYQDHLTGLMQRHALERLVTTPPDDLPVDPEVPRLDLSRAAVLVIDVDHFKSLNDRHGHHVGDAALKHIAGLLTTRVRAGDVACRWGGDEFIVLCQNLDAVQARNLADELIGTIRETPLVLGVGPQVDLSLTIGVAHASHVTRRERRLGPERIWHRLYERADHALYQAKESGRGCAVGPYPDLQPGPRDTSRDMAGPSPRALPLAARLAKARARLRPEPRRRHDEIPWHRRGMRSYDEMGQAKAGLMCAIALMLVTQSVISYFTTGYPAFVDEPLPPGWDVAFVVGLPTFLLAWAWVTIRVPHTMDWLLGTPTLVFGTALLTFVAAATGDETVGSQYIGLAILALAAYHLRTGYAVLAAVLALAAWVTITTVIQGWDAGLATLSASWMAAGSLTLLLSQSRDQEEHLVAQLEQQAQHDDLTGASSRRALAPWTEERSETLDKVGLLIIDLDGFKTVNDTFGHPTGDALLHHLVSVVTECIRRDDLVVRLGGDEFAVLFSDITVDELTDRARHIRNELETNPLLLADGQRVPLTASFGSAHPDELAAPLVDNLDPLLHLADTRMYHAKHARAAVARTLTHPLHPADPAQWGDDSYDLLAEQPER